MAEEEKGGQRDKAKGSWMAGSRRGVNDGPGREMYGGRRRA